MIQGQKELKYERVFPKLNINYNITVDELLGSPGTYVMANKVMNQMKNDFAEKLKVETVS